jgi:hypothetical protein
MMFYLRNSGAACVVLILLLCAASAFAQDRFHIAAAFRPDEPLPLDVANLPVGGARTLNIRVAPDYDAAFQARVLLWLAVRDIDAADEAMIYINGRGPYRPPETMIGEGGDHEGRGGYIATETSAIQPGDNEIRFVFTGNSAATGDGYQIIDAALLVAGDETRSLSQIVEPVERYIDLPNFGSLAVLDRSLSPYKVKLVRDVDRGWKTHTIRRGDGRGGWTIDAAEHRFLHIELGERVVPVALERFDDGRIVLFCAWHDGRRQRPVMLASEDQGATFGDWRTIAGVVGFPSMVAYAGKGDVSFEAGDTRYFSADGGRNWFINWKFRSDVPLAPNGGPWLNRGQPLVERQTNGEIHLAAAGYNFGPPGSTFDAAKPSIAYFRRSVDGGRTWLEAHSPPTWTQDIWHEGGRYARCVAGGSLIRAVDGAIVAALRGNVPVPLIDRGTNAFEGLAVSRSLDNGQSWSPLNVLYPAGRTFGHFVSLPDERIALIYVLAENIGDDMQYADFNRGVEAIISDDDGQTWPLDQRIVLDAWPYVTADRTVNFASYAASTLLDDETILTAYAHSPTGGIVLVKWKP